MVAAGGAARPASLAAASTAVIASRVLRTWGESESGLNERLDDVIDRLDAPGHADARLPRQRLGGAEGPAHGEGRDGRRLRRGSSTSGSA